MRFSVFSRLAACSAAAAFSLWVLPLGFFIGANQEKTACDGKRAFHMCCSLTKTKAPAPSAGISFQNAASPEKNSKPASGSNGDDLLLKSRMLAFENSKTNVYAPLLLFLTNPSLYWLDAVPKF